HICSLHTHVSSFPTRRSSDLNRRSLPLSAAYPASKGLEELSDGGTIAVKADEVRVIPQRDPQPGHVGLQVVFRQQVDDLEADVSDRKSTRMNYCHQIISYDVF